MSKDETFEIKNKFKLNAPVCVDYDKNESGTAPAIYTCLPDDESGNCGQDNDCSCSGEKIGNPGNGATTGGGVSSLPAYPRTGEQYKPVDLANGGVDVTSTSIGSSANMGFQATMSYSNQMRIGGVLTTIDHGTGLNWFLNLDGRIFDNGNDRIVVMLLPGRSGEKYYFQKLPGGGYRAERSNAELAELTDTWEMTVDGQKVIFGKASGAILQTISTGGVVTDFNYSGGRLASVVTAKSDGSNYEKHELLLEYATPGGGGSGGGPGGGPGGPGGPGGGFGGPGGGFGGPGGFSVANTTPLGVLKTITQRTYVGTQSNPADADYDLQRRLEFVIPESTSSGRYVARNLHKIHQQIPDASGGWTTESTQMFIYYTSGGDLGFLKYVIDNAGYQSLASPDTATDAQYKAASTSYYQYDNDFRVSRIETCGGTQWSTITYVENSGTPKDPANNWKRKSVYTSNDGSVKTVYSNHFGADMLLDETMGSDRWVQYFKFDSNGRETERYSPSCIDFTSAPYDESQNDLNVQLKSDSGRIDLTAWYSGSGNGAAEGRLESRHIKNGTAGVPIMTFKREYTSRSVAGVTIYPVAKETYYPEETGSGTETTYSYTWHSGTLMPQRVTTNLPDVPASQNGLAFPQNDTVEREFNLLGQTISSTDARGTVTQFEYDAATGAMIQQRLDSAAGGLDLTTDYTVSLRGRQIRSLGPVHDVDGVSVRTASWNVKVSKDESLSAAGFQTVSTGNFKLVNPVTIRKQSSDGTVVDQITAKRGSSVESSGELSSDDSFPQSSWTAWTQTISNVCGQMAETRVYHNIPSFGSGSNGTNYSRTLYGYDSMGRRNRVETADGTIERTVFNVFGQPVSSWIGTDDSGATDSDPTGNGALGNDMVLLSSNEYDNNQSGGDSLLTRSTVPQTSDPADNRVTSFQYDWRNRQIASIAQGPAYNHVSRQTFDNVDRSIKTESLSDDGTGEVLIARSESFYDARGRVYQSKRHGVDQATGALTGETITVDMQYDAGDSMTKQTPAGGSDDMTYVHDALGRRTSQTNALNQTSSMVYNDAGQAISSTDALGNTSLSKYDEIGRMVKSVNPLGQTVSESEYDAAGRMAATVDGVGNRTEFTYDDAGRRTGVTDPAGKTSTMTYDSMGRVTQSKDPLNNTVTFQYDYRGRQTVVTDPVLEQTESVYDRVGNVVEQIDARGESTRMAYDTLGRQTSLTDRLGKVTSFGYDRAGRRSRMTDAQGSETVYGFDSFGRSSTTRYPDHVSGAAHGDLNYGIVLNEYDAKDRLEKRTDQKGNSVTHHYDAAGRMTSRAYRKLGSSTVVDTDTFSYDGNGRMLTAASGRYGNTVAFSYDSAGRKSSESQTVDSRTYTTSYGYDAASRVTSMTYPDGSVVARSYNARGLLDEVELDGKFVQRRTYDDAGRVAAGTYGNAVVTSYAHRGDGLISSIATTNSGKQKVGTYAYAWDANRNKTSETISGAGFMSNFGFSVGVGGYDDENRLLNWDRNDGKLAQAWSRSAVGNWTQKTENSSSTSYTHSDAHELTSIGGSSITYDANGNALLSSSGDSLGWDLDNRLNAAGSDVSFAYDALGRRVSMSEGSSTTTLVCPDSQLIAMYDSGASASSAQRIFVYGSYIDEPLMMKAGSVKSYYSRNQQFSITALTNASGNVVERYAYDAHGDTIIMSATGALRSGSSLGNPFAFTGRFLHNELGLMHFRARYYDANTGEFLSRDPLEYVDGMSLYRGYFVMRAVDPLGSSCVKPSVDGLTYVQGRGNFITGAENHPYITYATIPEFAGIDTSLLSFGPVFFQAVWVHDSEAFKTDEDPCCCCDKIAWVQMIKGKEKWWGIGPTPRDPEYGWAIDGGIPYPQTAGGEEAISGVCLEDQLMRMDDLPTRFYTIIAYPRYWKWDAEVCAICLSGKEGPVGNRYVTYGCTKWGFEFEAFAGLFGASKIEFSGYTDIGVAPSANWAEALNSPPIE